LATKTFYLQNAAATGGNGGQLLETTATDVITATGWVVGTGSTNSGAMRWGVEWTPAWSGTTDPDGSLDNTSGQADYLRTESAYTGTFANANWTFTFSLTAETQGGAADGRIVLRLFRGANADGSSATEITSAQQQCGIASNVGTKVESALTLNPGSITLTNEYLFVQVAWLRTGAGGMSTSDVHLVTGSSSSVGTRIVSSNFAATHSTTGALTAGTGALAGTAERSAGAVTHTTTGALTGPGAVIAGTAAHFIRVIRAPLQASIVRKKASRTAIAVDFQPYKQPVVYHDASGALTGPGSVLAGTANRTHLHPTTGVLVGPGADLDGTATHSAPGGSHATSGALTGAGATLSGTATHRTLHATSGALAGPGASLAGTAVHRTLHATSGALAGSGAVLVGTAAHFTRHATASTLVGPGASLAGVATRLDPGAVPGPGKATPSDRLINGSATPSDRAASAAPSDRGLGSAGLSER
jgi:hypothetical protein